MKPDEQFAHFIIVKQIGYGGMATVYQATDSRSGRNVALKILHDQYSQDEEVIQRFNREADIFYNLMHPNIVPIVAHGEHDGKFYIAMGYMAGGNLFKIFSKPKTVESNFTVGVLDQVASALDFAHQKGVIHRDLKLENILLDDKNTAYLADFGIAFLTDATRLTSHQTIAGTPLYMSPEQALGLSVTPSSDVYSLAVMAYLMVTGYHPFTGRDPYTVLNQHISQPPPVPTTVNETLPLEVDEVLLKGLAKKPHERYATATEFVQAFADAVHVNNQTTQTLVRLDALNPQAIKNIEDYKDTLMAQPDTSTVVIGSDQQKPSSRRRLIIGGLIVLVVLIAGLAFGLDVATDTEELAIAQTQAWQAIEADMTATVLAIEPVAITTRRSTLRESPQSGSEEFGRLDSGETVNLIGRSEDNEFVQIALAEGGTGYIKADSIETDYDLNNLPITHRRGEKNNSDDNG